MNSASSDSLRDPRILIALLSAICFSCILLPLSAFPSPPIISGHPWKVELLFSILLLIFFAAGMTKYRSSFWNLFKFDTAVIRSVSRPLILFIVWSGMSFFWAGSAPSVFHHTLVWCGYLIIFILAYALIAKGRSVKSIVLAFALASVVLTISCLVDYFGISDFSMSEGTLRVRYGKYAELLLTIAPILWAVVMYSKRSGRSHFFLLAGVGAWLTAMLSLSKGAFISGVLAFAVFFVGNFFFSKRSRRPRVLKLAALWLVITVAAQVVPTALTSIPSTSDYISGSADATRETSNVRLFIWSISGQMIASHWLVGIGADNFGIEFNRARPAYESDHPSTERDVAEFYMAERSHNEFLQIFAELGIVGLLLFGSAFAAFLYYAARSFLRNGGRFSPLFWGSAAGLAGFLVSSQFSSFSFRVMQNGIVFFLLFAIAIYELSKTGKRNRLKTHQPAFRSTRPVFAAACVLTLLLFVYSSLRGLSYVFYYQAGQAVEPSEIERLYTQAERFDGANGGAYFSHAQWRARQGDHQRASELFRAAIDRGVGVTLSYSLLAKSEKLSGRPDVAEKTLAEAVSIFPRSVFARVRYAVILEEHAKMSQAADQLSAARAIDPRQAAGWYHMIKEGSVTAIYKAMADPDIAKPAELRPDNAVFEFLDTQSFEIQSVENASND